MINDVRLKSESASNNRLVPKSLLSIVISNIRVFFSYCENVITLPISFYLVLSAYLLSLLILPLMILANNEIWGEYPTLSNTLYLISFFLRLGSLYTGANQVIISSIFNIAFAVVFMLPLLIFSSIYKVKGRVPKYFCFLTTLCTDFLIPIICLWIPSQIGTIVGLLINPKPDQSTSIFIILLFALIIIFLLLYTFVNSILFPQVNFTQGRTITWIGNSMLYIYSYVAIILFLTRICEIIDNNTARVTIICFYSIFTILSIFFTFYFLPFIDTNFSSIFMGGSSASIIVIIFIILKFYIDGVESLMLIILFALFFLSSTLISEKLIKNKEIKILATLDRIYQNQVEFNEAFKNSNQFLLYSRTGFKNAHPYILDFDLFDQAVLKWPHSRNVWIQYLRFLAVYFEKKTKLVEVLSEMKKQKFEGTHIKGFRTLLKYITNSRKRHFSSDLKVKFKLLDEQIRATKNLLVIYWSAIEECSSSTAYDIGKQLNKLIQNIESMFLHFDLLYPNNSSISTKFSKFLSSIVFDSKLAESWKKKATQLRDQKRFIFDMTQQFAFETFPLLPRSLNERQLDAHLPVLEGSVSMTDNHGNESQSQISMTALQSENAAYESSSIRQLALKAPVPFIRNLMILLLCSTFVCFFIGPFVVAFFVFHQSSSMRPYLSEISTTCRISELIASISNYVFIEAMKIENTFPSNEKYIVNQINSTEQSYSNTILNKIISVTKVMHEFNVFAITSLKVDSISSTSLFLTPVSYVTYSLHSNGSLLPSTAKLTLNEGISALIGDFSQFSPDYIRYHISFMAEEWFISCIKNSYNVAPSVLDFVFYLCCDVRSLLINLKSNTLIITIVFSIISILFLPAEIVMIINIKKQWNSIIKIINSLPHMAIQKTISHFSHLRSLSNLEQNAKFESKYTNTFIKMISSRDVKNGLSIRFLIGLIISHMILSIIAFVAFYFIIDAITQRMIFIPYSLYLSENLLSCFNRCSFLVLRCITMTKGRSFCDDTRETLSASFNEIMPRTRDSLNSFLFVEDHEYGTGILSSSMDFIEGLFDDNGDWRNKEISNQIILQMPRIMMFDVIYEIINRLYFKITTVEYTTMLSEDDENFILLTNFVLDHLFENSFKEINDNFEDLMKSMISQQNVILFIISIAIFFIGIIFLIVIVNQFLTILNTTRFCLSSLSMIDVHFLTDVSDILQLFSGNFDSSNIDKNSLLPSLLKTQEIVEDSIIIVNEDFCISSFNKAASLNFNLSNNLSRESRIDAILNFEDQKVLQCAAVMLFNTTDNDEFSGLKEATFDTRVAPIDSSFPDFIQAVTMKLVNDGLISNQLVILIAKQDQFEKEIREINENKRKIEELKKAVIPKQIREKVDIKSDFIKLSIKNAIIVTFQCIYDDKNDIQNFDMKTVYQFCYDIIQELMTEFNDVCFIKGFGNSICLCFNMIEQNYILMESLSDAISFALKYFELCKNNEIVMQCGMSYDILAQAGMISTNRLSFDYYGESRKSSAKLAWNSKPYTIVFDSNLNDFISEEYRDVLKTITIDEDGQIYQCLPLSNSNEA